MDLIVRPPEFLQPLPHVARFPREALPLALQPPHRRAVDLPQPNEARDLRHRVVVRRLHSGEVVPRPRSLFLGALAGLPEAPDEETRGNGRRDLEDPAPREIGEGGELDHSDAPAVLMAFDFTLPTTNAVTTPAIPSVKWT